MLKNHKLRQKNIKRFKADFPQFKKFSNKQVMIIFKMYKDSIRRQNEVSSISFLVAGTLIILITSLFVNSGAPMTISNNDLKPN